MSSARNTYETPLRWTVFCEGIIEASWLVVLLATPVFFLVYSDHPFDPCKAALIRILAVTGGMAWLAKVMTGGRPWRPVPASGVSGMPPITRWFFAGVVFSCGAMLVSTALSVDPRIAWHGSYGRALGASTQLATVVLFGLCVGHLRTRLQMARLFGVVWWGSVPVCLYALLQSLGLDPIARGPELARPGSTLGNPIFLGAYLSFALFFGLALLYMVVRQEVRGTLYGLRQGILISVCGLQVWVLATASSRGPILGVLAGFAFLGLLFLLRRPWGRRATGRPADWRRFLAVGLLVLVAGTAIPVLRLVKREITAGPAQASSIGRVSRILSLETRTAQVRLLLWRGAAAAFASPEPLPSADAEDRLHKWRPWVGHGQGSAVFALGRHEPAEMERLELDRAPDQAHNSALQALVSGGLVGLLAWSLVQVLTLALGARAFGILTSRAELYGFFAVVIVGAALGALAPWVGWGEPALSALGGVAGGLTGFACWLLRLWWKPPDQSLHDASYPPVPTRTSHQLSTADDDSQHPAVHSHLRVLNVPQSTPPRPEIRMPSCAQHLDALVTRPGEKSGLAAILLAAWLSHVVEGQFGIDVTTLAIYGALTLAAFVVVASGWLEPYGSASAVADRPLIGPGMGIVAALFAVLLVFVFGIARHEAPELVWSQLENQHAVGWLVIVTATAGLALVGNLRGLVATITGAVVGVAGFLLYLLAHPWLTGRVTRSDDIDAGIAAVAFSEALLATVVLAVVVPATVAWGWRLSRSLSSAGGEGPQTGVPRARRWTVVVVSCCAALVAVSWFDEIRSLRSSFLARGAMSLAARHRYAEAEEVMGRARSSRPQESRLALLQGRIAFDRAQTAQNLLVRDDLMDRAKAALEEALELSPFDADHVANLGRWHLAVAGFAPATTKSKQELEAAAELLERALEMRPGALRWRRELASTLERQGDLDGAIENLETVHEILSTDAGLMLDLADLQRARTIRSLASGATEVARRSADEAVRLSGLAVALEPENRRARQAQEASRSLLIFPDDPPRTEEISDHHSVTETP